MTFTEILGFSRCILFLSNCRRSISRSRVSRVLEWISKSGEEIRNFHEFLKSICFDSWHTHTHTNLLYFRWVLWISRSRINSAWHKDWKTLAVPVNRKIKMIPATLCCRFQVNKYLFSVRQRLRATHPYSPLVWSLLTNRKRVTADADLFYALHFRKGAQRLSHDMRTWIV